MEALSTGVWREGELENARAALIHSLPSKLETNARVAEAMTRLALDGPSLDFYQTLPAQVAKVDEASIARVVKKYLDPAALSAVVVGTGEGLEVQLQALKRGPVVRVP